MAVLRPSSEDSLSKTPQYIEHNQLHSIINLCSLQAASIVYQPPLLLTHIASHSLVGMQDLSDLLEVRLSLFWEPHFGEAFFSSAYPISYRLFFVPRTREVSWWKGKEFRQEVHSLTCSRNSLRYLHIHQASLPLHRGKSSITDSSFAVWKATEKSQRV